MRIRSVTPVRVDPGELSRRRDRYRRLCPPGVRFSLEPAGPGAPLAFATQEDIAASTASVTHALGSASGNDDGFDFRMPDCVLDPAVPLTPDGARVPAVGMLRLAASHLTAAGREFGAVTRNRAIADALAERVEEYGYGPWFAGVTVLDLDFDAIPDTGRWNETVRDALKEFAARGVTAVVNGCSAVDTDGNPDGNNNSNTPDARRTAELIDPARLALRLLAAGATP